VLTAPKCSQSVEGTRQFAPCPLPHAPLSVGLKKKLIQCRQHKKTHSRPVKCQACSKTFAARTDLTRHISTVHRIGQRRCECTIGNCKFTSKRKDNLAQHIRTIHPRQPPNPNGSINSPEGSQPWPLDIGLFVPAAETTSNTSQAFACDAFMKAASIGNTSFLEHLLCTGLHVDIQAEDGYTALHCAAKTGSVATISCLLHNGATVDLCNSKIQGRRPVHEAVLENRTEAFALLLYKGANLLLPDTKGRTVIDYVGQTGDVNMAQIMFREEHKKIYALDMAKVLAKSCVKSGNCSVLEWLLPRFPNAMPSSANVARSPICIATRRGHEATVAVILSWSQIPSHSTKAFIKAVSCSLMWAVSRGYVTLAKILLECNTMDPNQTDKERDMSPLQHAVVRGDLPMVELLLHHQKTDVDKVNHIGQAPLHIATIRGHS
jgi:hypothetical protein